VRAPCTSSPSPPKAPTTSIFDSLLLVAIPPREKSSAAVVFPPSSSNSARDLVGGSIYYIARVRGWIGCPGAAGSREFLAGIQFSLWGRLARGQTPPKPLAGEKPFHDIHRVLPYVLLCGIGVWSIGRHVGMASAVLRRVERAALPLLGSRRGR
jgi:hypothetical protein